MVRNIFSVLLVLAGFFAAIPAVAQQSAEQIKLPAPAMTGPMSLEQALSERRSTRRFSESLLKVEDLGQLLWAAQGMNPGGRRTAPSAGAIYPMRVYVFDRGGVFVYDPKDHKLIRKSDRDMRGELAGAALSQRSVAEAAAVFVLAAQVKKTAAKYKDRAVRYCDLEAGHIAQNVALQAQARGLGMVTIGAYNDDDVRKLLGLEASWRITYLLPLGYR